MGHIFLEKEPSEGVKNAIGMSTISIRIYNLQKRSNKNAPEVKQQKLKMIQ